MKKSLLFLIVALFAISAIGQPLNKKAQLTGSQKLQDLQNLRSLEASTQKLDSTISDLWNGSTWIFSSRKRYTYSVVGSMTTAISMIRDATTSFIWVNSGKTETTVDVNGKTTLNVTYTWNKVSSLWVGDIRSEFTYSGGNMTSNSTYTYNTGTSQWVGLNRTEYTYVSGNLTTDIGYTWDTTIPVPGWVNSTRTEYTYVSGILTSDLSYDWDKIGSSWGIPSGKTEYTYSGGNLASATSSTWDTGLAAWVYSSKSDYTYTGGKMTLNIVSTWDINTTSWINSSKLVSEYNDPDGRITLYSYYIYDAINSVWNGLIKQELSYGIQGQLNYTVTIVSGWDQINSLWVPQSRSTNWYSGITTGINKISEKNISVYPNPAKEFIVFDNINISESATVIVFDIQGKKIFEQQLSGNKLVSVNKLSKGLYIYKLYNNGIIYSGKLLKD